MCTFREAPVTPRAILKAVTKNPNISSKGTQRTFCAARTSKHSILCSCAGAGICTGTCVPAARTNWGSKTIPIPVMAYRWQSCGPANSLIRQACLSRDPKQQHWSLYCHSTHRSPPSKAVTTSCAHRCATSWPWQIVHSTTRQTSSPSMLQALQVWI